MQEKIVALAVFICLVIGLTVGCGSVGKNHTAVENATKGKKILEGTLSEKKDFMFVVEDGEKKPHVLAFSEKPDGYDELTIGDNVNVEYTGELSDVDAFTGEVLSITKKEAIKNN